MASPQYVGQVFYNIKTQGFSEVYPLRATNVTDARTAVNAIIAAREPTLAPDVRIVSYRISDPNIFGDSATAIINTLGTYVVGSVRSATPNLAVELKSGSGVTERSTRYMHCIPEDQLSAGELAPTAGWGAAQLAYIAELEADVAIMKANRTSTPPVFTFFSPITFDTAHFVVWTRKTGRPFGAHRGRARIRV